MDVFCEFKIRDIVLVTDQQKNQPSQGIPSIPRTSRACKFNRAVEQTEKTAMKLEERHPTNIHLLLSSLFAFHS